MVGVASVSVLAIERIPLSRKDGLTAQDIAEIAAVHLNLLKVDDVGTLVARNISSALLDQNSLSFSIFLEVQSTLP